MLTRTMTHSEMIREVTEDMKNIFRYLDHRENVYRRAVLKATRFPLVFAPFWYRSARKNDWLILVEAPSRQATHSNNSKITFVCMLNHDNGVYCFMPSWVQGKLVMLVFVPHFMSRYALRAGKDQRGRDLIVQYFRKNASYVYDLKEKELDGMIVTEAAGSTAEGVALGLVIHDGILFKTFVSYEMLKGEQVEVYTRNEQLRKEIHEL